MWLFNSSETIKDSGLLSGFTDWHCHLLPGVDDGVKEKQETLRILDLWQENGMAEVWLTPHTMDDFPNEPACQTLSLAKLLPRGHQGTSFQPRNCRHSGWHSPVRATSPTLD